jgi:Translation initiation factor 1 (IF-1)
MAGREESGPREAVVVELLPAAVYRVELDDRRQVVAHLAPAVRRDFVRLRQRDRVLVELTAGDPTRGRIVAVQRPGA